MIDIIDIYYVRGKSILNVYSTFIALFEHVQKMKAAQICSSIFISCIYYAVLTQMVYLII